MKTLVTLITVPVLVLMLGGAATSLAADRGQTFATPEAAVSALADAVSSQNRDSLRALFGLATDELVATDRVQATNELAGFTAAFNQAHQLAPQSETKFTLEVGPAHWPFPIPLVKQGGQWCFDTDAGKEELLNRRIGRNELEVLKVMRAYVEAQREYASRDRDGDEVLEYAQRLASSPGTKDGLFWSPDLDGELSPLGPLVAQAQGVGYDLPSTALTPEQEAFHGYYFKILTRQGKFAPGKAYNYIINGNMIGGFALVAWPADYGESGVMSFIVNQQGRVYQKDLGSKTAKIAAALKEYNPDKIWTLSPD